MTATLKRNPDMAPAPVTAKQEVEELLAHLPDDSTLDDIQYHLYVLEKVKRGRDDIASGRRQSQDEARKRLGGWLPR